MPTTAGQERGSAWIRGAIVGVLVLAACDLGGGSDDAASSRESIEARVADLLPVVVPAQAPVPQTAEAFLEELAPLPSESLLVVYEIEGPGGMQGSLEVLARRGGFRRENWTLDVPLGNEGNRRLSGSTIATPRGVWVDGQPEDSFVTSPLSGLAAAYAELPVDQRRSVVEAVREHAASLDRARSQAVAPAQAVLGVPCHETRVATISLCLWEATGLPLRYTSEGLSLVAVNIEVDPTIGEHAFDVPFEPPADETLDSVATLRRIAGGDLSDVVPLLHPGLRLPSA